MCIECTDFSAKSNEHGEHLQMPANEYKINEILQLANGRLLICNSNKILQESGVAFILL